MGELLASKAFCSAAADSLGFLLGAKFGDRGDQGAAVDGGNFFGKKLDFDPSEEAAAPLVLLECVGEDSKAR